MRNQTPSKRRKVENRSYRYSLVICQKLWSSRVLSGDNDVVIEMTQSWLLEDYSQLMYLHLSLPLSCSGMLHGGADLPILHKIGTWGLGKKDSLDSLLLYFLFHHGSNSLRWLQERDFYGRKSLPAEALFCLERFKGIHTHSTTMGKLITWD